MKCMMEVSAETEIVDYHSLFADLGVKLQFYVSICRKQMEVCQFQFLFALNKHKLPFSISSVYCIYTYIWIWKWNTIYMGCCFKQKMEAPAIFLKPFPICSSWKQKFVVCSCVDEEKNGSY